MGIEESGRYLDLYGFPVRMLNCDSGRLPIFSVSGSVRLQSE